MCIRDSLNYPAAFVHMNPACCQDPLQFRLDPPIVGGKNAGGATEEMILHCVGSARVTQHVLQPELHGEDQLNAACPCPHHTNTDSVRRRQHTRDEVLPALHKCADGLDGYHHLLGARHLCKAWGRANIERQHIIGHIRMLTTAHRLVGEIEPDDVIERYSLAPANCDRGPRSICTSSYA